MSPKRKAPRPLKTHRNIGRFLVDSSPGFWFALETFLAWVLFQIFASFSKYSRTMDLRPLNEKGAVVFAICFGLLGLGVGLFERENRFSRLASFQLTSLAGLLAMPLSLFALYLLTYEKVGRWSLFLGSAGSVITIFIFVHWLGAALLKRYPHRFVIIGKPSRVGEKLLSELKSGDILHFEHADELADYLNSEIRKASVDWDALAYQIREHSVSEVVVSWDGHAEERHTEFFFAVLKQGLRLVEDAQYYTETTRRIPLEDLPTPYVLKMGFDIHRPVHSFLKRFTDIVIAGILLALLLPFFLLIALLIRIESRGPAFYSQKRVGRFGREFKLAKFRTMQDRAESISYVTAREDKRITRFGSLLRVLHFDELPQLWNILVGDMSLVGPRPQPTQMVVDISETVPLFRLRHVVRPGLSGLAQIFQGKTTVESDEMMRKLSYDLFYIRNFNLFFDFWILSRTLFRMIQTTW